MNAKRRKALDTILVKLQEAQVDLESLAGEEREYADNVPENMQGNARHQQAEAYADELEDIDMELSTLADRLTAVIQE